MTVDDLAAKIGVEPSEIHEAIAHLEREHGWDETAAIARLDGVSPTPEKLRYSIESWRKTAGARAAP